MSSDTVPPFPNRARDDLNPNPGSQGTFERCPGASPSHAAAVPRYPIRADSDRPTSFVIIGLEGVRMRGITMCAVIGALLGQLLLPHGTSIATVAAQTPAAVLVVIGSQAAGTFADATGHSAQSHLVYAVNAGVWWLFTLTSAADSRGGAAHNIKAYRSSGADLATATWTAAVDSPGAAASASVNCGSCSMSGGRALSIAYVDNAPADVIHAEVAMAFDGQNGLTGHIRATVTATSIVWESWNYHDEPAATWTVPRATALGVSSGKYIHSGGPILQQEVDANARVSARPDTGSAWTSGFSPVSVIDNSMIHQNNAMGFAPLPADAMLAVYDDGGGTSTCYNCGQVGLPEPQLSNLRYKRSNADGSWPGAVVGSQGGGDGPVFATTAAIDQNDWALVAAAPSAVYAFRRNAAGTGVDAALYAAASNSWAVFAAPPAFAAGQSAKSGAGLFGAAAGSKIAIFVVSTDAANSILYSTWDETTWSPWAVVPGTGSGQHSRQFISGYPTSRANQIGLVWTEGTTQYDIFMTALPMTFGDSTPPAVAMTEPAAASTVFGTVAVAATASDNVGVTSVQFQIDGVNQDAPQATPPFKLSWDSTTVADGFHRIGATASDAAGNVSSAAVSVTVSNKPHITALSPSAGRVGTSVTIAGTTLGTAGTVAFNGTVSGATNWSDTRIVAPVPSGAATGPVVVTVGDVPSNGLEFIVAPAIATVVPSIGGTGATVAITGTNFGASATTGMVRFNGVPATAASWNDTRIDVAVPAGALSGPLVVAVSGVVSDPVAFTVTNPQIISMTPAAAPSGADVTIAGANFGTS